MNFFPFRLLGSALFFACRAHCAAEPLHFSFGDKLAAHFTPVTDATRFDPARGFGLEPGSAIRIIRGQLPGDASAYATSDRPFLFTARVPHEGNWRVTVTVGASSTASSTTIKAELRRLMVERVTTQPGETQRVTFIVNTRTPRIAPVAGIVAGSVRLKAPRESVQEAWAWDQAVTLEFSGTYPAVHSIEIEPVDVPTVFLLGDSTVCDQSKEPYSSWGQMITRWFEPTIAVANHGESGETYRDSINRRRLDKIASVMRPGDWLLMQFGHNDQKQIAAGNGGPFTTYKEEIRVHVDAIRARGGQVIIISPMERRGFDSSGEVKPSLASYAQAASEVAREMSIPFVDLNRLSRKLYAALGVERSALAFASLDGRVDNTHHNNFGSYELAQCIAEEIRRLKLPLAEHLSRNFKGFDPSHPDDPAEFRLPSSSEVTNQRPLGDDTQQ